MEPDMPPETGRLEGADRERIAELVAMAKRGRSAKVSPSDLGGADEDTARERVDAWLAEQAAKRKKRRYGEESPTS